MPPVKPSQVDIEETDAIFGPLPPNATVEERAHRWRLYVVRALLRDLDPDLLQPVPDDRHG